MSANSQSYSTPSEPETMPFLTTTLCVPYFHILCSKPWITPPFTSHTVYFVMTWSRCVLAIDFFTYTGLSLVAFFKVPIPNYNLGSSDPDGHTHTVPVSGNLSVLLKIRF